LLQLTLRVFQAPKSTWAVAPMVEPSHSAANFDVGVLFFNRARQTLECILSFLNDDIKPSIVVLDQGSAAGQRKLLEDALLLQPTVRFITLDENIGVGPGRNRLARECSADWVLFIDNDTVLNTACGAGLINSAVGHEDVDGYSPRILNVHEDRFMDRLLIAGQGQRLRFDVAGPDVPITNTFSGCAVVLRRSFLLNQPYDERIFVGFEDFELALRTFTRQIPMRIRSLDDVTLVHKHMPVVSDPDVTATRMRYSSSDLRKSFDVLATQYDANLFRGWEYWTSKQQKEMLPARTVSPRPARDKIALTFVVDAPNSRSDNMVSNLTRSMSAVCNSTAVYTHSHDEPEQVLRLVIESRPDVIHFLWRPDISNLICAATVNRCAALMGLTQSGLVDLLCQSHITFSVSDYLFLDREEIGSFRPLYWLSDGYCVTSSRLFDIYRGIADYPKPFASIQDSVEATRYHSAEPAEPAESIALWQCFFEDVIRNSHPDARNWRRFMIEKFFLGLGEPRD
jgi:glycosyltransferase involved in cell wall biosynthesis